MTYRLFDWGESMYGGYYAEAIGEDANKNCKQISFHADTLRELRAQLAEYGLKATANRRVDH